MSAAETLKAARAVGISVEIDGEDLVLQAPTPPPLPVVEALSRNKADIVALLRPTDDGWSAEEWQVFFDEQAGIAEYDGGLLRSQAEAGAFECCVVEWLNRNSASSPAGRCAWCGHAETHDAVVLPYGAEPGSHVWLHAECWGTWQEARRAHAVKELTLMGLSPPFIHHSSARSEHEGIIR